MSFEERKHVFQTDLHSLNIILFDMKKTSDLKYLPPVAGWSNLESEGIICLSGRVTVDEHRNVNADTPTEPYLEEPIVF